MFYIAACCSMGLSLYNLTVTSFCLVLAQALAHPPPPPARPPVERTHFCFPPAPSARVCLWQGLSLRGPPGSVATAVRIFRNQWGSIRSILILSLIAVFVAGLAIVWMKLEEEEFHYPTTPAVATAIVLTIFLAMVYKVFEMGRQLRVPEHELVAGDINVNIPGVNDDAQLDLVMEEAERIDAAR